jgi:hypothetical protein
MTSRSIRFGVLKEPSKDAGPYKMGKVLADGKMMDVQLWEPYGVQSSGVKDGEVLILTCDDDDSKAVGIVMPPPKDRIDGQKEGEATYANTLTGNELKHDAEGNTILKTKGGSITKHFKDGKIGVQPSGGQKVCLGQVDGENCHPVATSAGYSRNVVALV